MTYATVANLVQRYGADEIRQLTDRSMPPAGQIVDAVAEQAIADAEEVVNAHLGARYTLPLAAVHPLLEKITCDLARANLYGDRPLEQVTANREDAARMLAAIASGKLSLGLLNAGQSGGVEIATPQEPVFSRESLADY